MKSCEIFLLLKIRTMATNFSPCKGSYVLNQFPSNVMFGMNGFHVSASGAIQGHHGPLVMCLQKETFENTMGKGEIAHTEQFLLFSSPEHIVLRMSYCDRSLSGVRPSVCPSVNNYLKILLLWNRPTDFSETSQKWSLGDALSKYFKDLNSMENSGCHGNREKKL